MSQHEPRTKSEAEALLTGPPLTTNYRPSVVASMSLVDEGGRLPFVAIIRDIERMIIHPDVILPYSYYKAGIAEVRFTVRARNLEEAKYVHALYCRFWERSLEQAQLCYDYGWGAYEICYRQEKGYLHYDALSDLHPLDVWALTDKGHYRGVSLQGTSDYVGRTQTGRTVLRGPSNWPAKGLWLSHNRRFNRYYGRTQLQGGWRPWRRLATRDGAEEIIDGGVYRFAYKGPMMRYPVKSFKKADGSVDYDGARDKARQFVEQAKAGASLALPNSRDDKGEFEWSLDWPDHTINVDGLLNYEQRLQKQISRGVGVPPELFEASETGSGWSGRKIPLIGFYVGQLRNARSIVWQTKGQLADPLLKWNFGKGAWCEVEVSVEIPEALSGDMGQGGQGGAPAQPQPAPGGGGASGKIPYKGPRGGRGQRDPRTGKVYYGLSTLDDDDGTPKGQFYTLAGPSEGVSVSGSPGGPLQVMKAAPRRSRASVQGTPPGGDPWEAHTIKSGPRKGQGAWKNKNTGRIVVGQKPVWKPAEYDALGRKKGQRAAPLHERARVEDVLSAVRQHASDPALLNADSIKDLTEQLLSLRVKDIHDIKRSLTLKASGRKADLIAKVLKRALPSEEMGIAARKGGAKERPPAGLPGEMAPRGDLLDAHRKEGQAKQDVPDMHGLPIRHERQARDFLARQKAARAALDKVKGVQLKPEARKEGESPADHMARVIKAAPLGWKAGKARSGEALLVNDKTGAIVQPTKDGYRLLGKDLKVLGTFASVEEAMAGKAEAKATPEPAVNKSDNAFPADTAVRDATRHSEAVSRAPKGMATALTKQQKRALELYIGDSYEDINAAMRRGQPLDGRDAKIAQHINDALAATPPLDKPLLVWRGIALPVSEHQAFLSQCQATANAGGVLTLSGFQSTSLDADVALGFGLSRLDEDEEFAARRKEKTLLFEISARHGICLSGSGNGGNDAEAEMLLPHNNSYRVIGVKSVPFKEFKNYVSGQTVVRYHQVVQIEQVVEERSNDTESIRSTPGGDQVRQPGGQQPPGETGGAAPAGGGPGDPGQGGAGGGAPGNPPAHGAGGANNADLSPTSQPGVYTDKLGRKYRLDEHGRRIPVGEAEPGKQSAPMSGAGEPVLAPRKRPVAPPQPAAGKGDAFESPVTPAKGTAPLAMNWTPAERKHLGELADVRVAWPRSQQEADSLYLLIRRTRPLGEERIEQIAAHLGVNPDAPALAMVREAEAKSLAGMIGGRIAGARHLHDKVKQVAAVTAPATDLDYDALNKQIDQLDNDIDRAVEEQFGMGSLEVRNAAKQRKEDLSRQREDTLARMYSGKSPAREKVQELATVKNHTNPTVAVPDWLKGQAGHKNARRATEFLSGLIARGPQDEHLPEYGVDPAPDDRGCYWSHKHAIGATTTLAAKVWAHEIGHGIEDKMPGAKAACQAFLAHRVGDEEPVPLKELFPESSYKDHEKGRRDKFYAAFGDNCWYVGKPYADGSTEILSMGVEKLYDDPAAFCQADPEYAAFVLGILDGTLRQGLPEKHSDA